MAALPETPEIDAIFVFFNVEAPFDSKFEFYVKFGV
jgi:hypothetical protein